MRVAHVITGLRGGGTVAMLLAVLKALQARQDIEPYVIGLLDDGASGQMLREWGIPVDCVHMPAGIPDPRAVWKLGRLLKAWKPDLIQSWLYHPDLLASLVAPWIGKPPVLWNIRHATLDPAHDSRSTLWTAKACAWLSRRCPARILVNSVSGRDVHIAYGYDASKMVVVPNGFDIEKYQPSEAARRELRQSLNLAAETPLIGMVARFSAIKGHELFIRSMELVARQHSGCHFVLCGRDVDAQNAQLSAWIQATGISARFHRLGERVDAQNVHAGLDIEVSASSSEAFSNSIGEALSCGVPVVATDVGDSGWLVGRAGRVVKPNDAVAMAQGCLEILSLSESQKADLSRQARERIQTEFEIGGIANRYAEIWQDVLRERSGATR